MAKQPLATVGNFLHIYDFQVKPGSGEAFIEAFRDYDQSGTNPMHDSPAQVSDGVLCRDDRDPDHFYLIAEWSDKEAHRKLRQQVVANERRRKFIDMLVDPSDYQPIYADVMV